MLLEVRGVHVSLVRRERAGVVRAARDGAEDLGRGQDERARVRVVVREGRRAGAVGVWEGRCRTVRCGRAGRGRRV